MICTAPGLPVVAARKARRTVSGSLSADFTCTDSLVTGSNRRTQSSSVSVARASPANGMSLIRRISGTDELLVTVEAMTSERLDQPLDAIGQLTGVKRTVTTALLADKCER